MSKQVTVYYALQSPWTYLGWARLRELVVRSSAIAHFRPIQIAPVFEASGTLMLAQRPKQRQAYRLMELRRWRDYLGIPLNLHPKYFPVDESLAARMVIAHRQLGGDIAAYSQATMTAVWTEERDLSDRATLLQIAREQGADGPTLLEAAEKSAVREEYDANTQAAIKQGVFGMPTFVIDDELFWGQDRLEFVARALGLLPRAGEAR
jgi:2-hydroxychromene-2-carboxylate isomerase